jgi:hypothetical protein
VLFQLGFLYTALLSIMQQFAGTDAVLKPVEEVSLAKAKGKAKKSKGKGQKYL